MQDLSRGRAAGPPTAVVFDLDMPACSNVSVPNVLAGFERLREPLSKNVKRSRPCSTAGPGWISRPPSDRTHLRDGRRP